MPPHRSGRRRTRQAQCLSRQIEILPDVSGVEVDVFIDLAPVGAYAAQNVGEPKEEGGALPHHRLLLEGGRHIVRCFFGKSDALQDVLYGHELIKSCGHVLDILKIKKRRQRMERCCRRHVTQRAAALADHLHALRAPQEIGKLGFGQRLFRILPAARAQLDELKEVDFFIGQKIGLGQPHDVPFHFTHRGARRPCP